MKILLCLQVLFSLLYIPTRSRKPNPAEAETTAFLDNLLKDYDGRIRPEYDGPPVNVTFAMHILSLGSIVETTMDYKATVFLRQSWTDPRLKFSQFNRTMTLAPSFLDDLWVPDTFILNEKFATFHKITTDNKLIRLEPNGKILYSARITLTLSCPMNLQDFPMDEQQCAITMESYAFTTNDVRFLWQPSDPLSLDANINLPQFDIVNYTTVSCTRRYSTGDYPCLEAQFFLSRQMGYYLIQTYVPSFLIVILSWVSFWISPDASPARVALGITTVLTMTTQSSGILQSLPKVSYVKAIDVWMATCLLFVFAALIEFAVVNYWTRKQKRRAKKMQLRANFQRGVASATLTNVNYCYIGSQADISDSALNGANLKARMTKQPQEEPVDVTNLIDSVSRVVFPAFFIIFNMVYWFVFVIKAELAAKMN